MSETRDDCTHVQFAVHYEIMRNFEAFVMGGVRSGRHAEDDRAFHYYMKLVSRTITMITTEKEFQLVGDIIRRTHEAFLRPCLFFEMSTIVAALLYKATSLGFTKNAYHDKIDGVLIFLLTECFRGVIRNTASEILVIHNPAVDTYLFEISERSKHSRSALQVNELLHVYEHALTHANTLKKNRELVLATPVAQPRATLKISDLTSIAHYEAALDVIRKDEGYSIQDYFKVVRFLNKKSSNSVSYILRAAIFLHSVATINYASEMKKISIPDSFVIHFDKDASYYSNRYISSRDENYKKAKDMILESLPVTSKVLEYSYEVSPKNYALVDIKEREADIFPDIATPGDQLRKLATRLEDSGIETSVIHDILEILIGNYVATTFSWAPPVLHAVNAFMPLFEKIANYTTLEEVLSDTSFFYWKSPVYTLSHKDDSISVKTDYCVKNATPAAVLFFMIARDCASQIEHRSHDYMKNAVRNYFDTVNAIYPIYPQHMPDRVIALILKFSALHATSMLAPIPENNGDASLIYLYLDYVYARLIQQNKGDEVDYTSLMDSFPDTFPKNPASVKSEEACLETPFALGLFFETRHPGFFRSRFNPASKTAQHSVSVFCALWKESYSIVTKLILLPGMTVDLTAIPTFPLIYKKEVFALVGDEYNTALLEMENICLSRLPLPIDEKSIPENFKPLCESLVCANVLIRMW